MCIIYIGHVIAIPYLYVIIDSYVFTLILP